MRSRPTRSSFLALLVACAALTVLAPGCGPSIGSPEAALEALAAALRAGDADGAYALMSRSYRARVSREEFRALFSSQPDEIARTADALSHRAGPVEEEARIEWREHERIELAREGGAWRIVTDVVDYYSQASPRDAVRSFVRAAEHRRFDVLLGLLPATDRAGTDAARLEALWTGEGREGFERLVGSLRAGLEAPIETHGDRATMEYGEHARAELALEGERWVIVDPD